MINLDRIAAETSQSILSHIDTFVKARKLEAKDFERVTTNALGVLQEQGLYAFFLYLLSKSGEETEENKLKADEMVSCIMVEKLLNLLNTSELECLRVPFTNDWDKKPAQINEDKKKILQHTSGQICVDLRRLLVVKTLFEQTLIYTRYGAKAFSSSMMEGS